MTVEQQIAQSVALAIRSAVSPLLERIAVLEARAPIPGPEGLPGLPGLPGEPGPHGEPGIEGARGADGKDGAPGLNGKDGAAGLNGKDGAQGLNGKDGAAGLNGKDGAQGLNGKDAILPDLELLAQKAAVLVPLAKDGRDGLPGIPGRDGATGEPGRDGIDGKHGAPGEDGKDGRPGPNGKDGLGFVDLKLAFDESKGWQLVATAADGRSKVWDVPMPYDAGVWESARVYHAGAGVTLRGAFWIAQRATSARPGDDTPESRAWRLAVKGGKDGKPGKDGRDAE